MGGKVFQHSSTSDESPVTIARLDPDTYAQVVAQARQAFAEAGAGLVDAAPHIQDKASFGDVDMIVALEHLDQPGTVDGFLERAQKALGADRVVLNAHRKWVDEHGEPVGRENQGVSVGALRSYLPDQRGVASFRVPVSGQPGVFHHVDAILGAPATFAMAIDYFSYNDLGNLLGISAKRWGLALGPEGLLYKKSWDGQPPQVFVVSSNWDEVLTFLNYSPERFRQGFATREAMFEFAASSRDFEPQRCLPENRSGDNRRRDQGRANFVAFVDWLRDQGRLDQPLRPEQDPDDIRWHLYRAFPHLHEQVNQAYVQQRRREQASKVFNGTLVQTWTGLSGADLGQFLPHARAQLGGDSGLLRLAEQNRGAVENAVRHLARQAPATTARPPKPR